MKHWMQWKIRNIFWGNTLCHTSQMYLAQNFQCKWKKAQLNFWNIRVKLQSAVLQFLMYSSYIYTLTSKKKIFANSKPFFLFYDFYDGHICDKCSILGPVATQHLLWTSHLHLMPHTSQSKLSLKVYLDTNMDFSILVWPKSINMI